MAERAAWLSIAVNVVLTLLNMAIAAASGSLAVAAEMVHNLVDLVAAVAVLAGVKVSQRKSRAFPYGLYKVENVVAVVIAVLIFVTGYEIAKQSLLATGREATVTPLMLGGVALSAIIPLAFSFYEMRVGRAVNSPSLMADAQEYRVHVFSSGVVFAALVGQMIGWPLDRAAALLIVLLIAKTGWELLQDGMRVLLDASLDGDTLAQVRTIIEAEPSLAALKSLTGRNAGRYRFLEAEVTLRVQDLDRAHAITERLEQAVRAQVPHVERVLIHVEPLARTHLRYAIPLEDPGGAISQHFGEAPYFVLVTRRTADGTIERQEVIANPHTEVPKAKGIRVAEWLIERKVDVVLLKESLQGKGPEYVFGDGGVETRLTGVTTLAEALAALPEEG
ncbi:MAG: cation diffusion facilitator family transporter [Chloroflexi bacterium]|nr:cation diffusion facilitator family transporter [Chloroflexota bacterium]